MTDPIVALATAAGQGGVAVIRVSGNDLQPLATKLTGIVPKPRYAHSVTFKDSAGGLLDQGILLWFKAPHSYTGEDVLELHTHGGELAPRRVLEACLHQGVRLAEPGEFTKRAFLNGKLTLVQAEAVADLINANSDAAARGAVRSLVGVFSDQVKTLQHTLTRIRVELESGFDFPEEGLDEFKPSDLKRRISTVAATLQEWIENGERWSRLQAGTSVVIVGAPNAGKSSLLNALAEDALAIVSDEPGTTRDAVRVQLRLEGLLVEITDTAGIRETTHAIERKGIERTRQAAAQADLILWLRSPDADDSEIKALCPPGVDMLEVWNKRDQFPQTEGFAISAKTGEGLAELKTEMLNRLRHVLGTEPGFLPRLRHLALLKAALQHLSNASMEGLAEEYMAEELRGAQKCLDPLLGEFASDDLLGEIFSTFCIGK